MIPVSKVLISSHRPISLKSKIMKVFLINLVITFVCFAITSHYAISSILTNKIKTGILSNLEQVKLSLENTINNLNHVSQQLSHQGMIGKTLYEYLLSTEPYDRLMLVNEITTELNLITFTNPNIGLTMYYFKNDNDYLFENYRVKADFDLDKLPVMAEYYAITYYGPHISNDLYNNQYVLSALRKVELPSRDDVFIYVESSFNLTKNLLHIDNSYKDSSYLIVDNDGFISYSSIPEIFPVQSRFSEGIDSNISGSYGDYYWFKSTSNQGWSLLSIIPKQKYYSERNQWVKQMMVFSLFLMLFNIIMAWLILQSIYKPLNVFNKEIKWITENDFVSKSEETNIEEFDYLLEEFNNMKKQILSLIDEIEQKEKKRVDIEIEKLRYQINPHFLLNTLNTAQWMAIMNNQDSIGDLLKSLSRLLYHNLGRMDEPATIQDEIDSINEYLSIQKTRYDFSYDIKINVDQSIMSMAVPRFILQPLVENAIHHGLNDNGYIKIEVKHQGHRVLISIQDDGPGMPQDVVSNMMSGVKSNANKVGMGIGMSYVKQMIDSYYNGQAEISIESEEGKGTNVVLNLPITKEA